MMDRTPKPGQLYNHIKNKPYQIITVAEHAETGEKMVVYQALYGNYGIYVRPMESFLSKVDHVNYPDSIHEETMQQEIKGSDSPVPAQSQEKLPSQALQEGQVNSVLMEFLDAESYYKKLEIVTLNKIHLDDRLINDMAVSLDCTVEEGPIDDRIESLIYCLQALCRFENKRLR